MSLDLIMIKGNLNRSRRVATSMVAYVRRLNQHAGSLTVFLVAPDFAHDDDISRAAVLEDDQDCA